MKIMDGQVVEDSDSFKVSAKDYKKEDEPSIGSFQNPRVNGTIDVMGNSDIHISSDSDFDAAARDAGYDSDAHRAQESVREQTETVKRSQDVRSSRLLKKSVSKTFKKMLTSNHYKAPSIHGN